MLGFGTEGAEVEEVWGWAWIAKAGPGLHLMGEMVVLLGQRRL